MTVSKSAIPMRGRLNPGKVIGNILLFALVVIHAVPVIWLIYLSLKTNTEIMTSPLAPPKVIQWVNYLDAFRTIPFLSMIANTAIVIAVSVPAAMLFSIFAAFAIGRMRFGGRAASTPTSCAASSCPPAS